METILKDWGFEDLIAVFNEQEIDKDALLCLDMNSLKELIPKVGPRMKFFTKLKQYQDIMNMEVLIPDESNKQTDMQSFEVLDTNDLIVQDTFSPSSSTSTDGSETRNCIETAFQCATKSKLSFCGQPALKRACRNAYHLNLRSFLNTTVTGKFILNSYEKEHRFTTKMRSQLAFILISGLMSQNSDVLLPLDFEILSEKICELFPTETEQTYYIPRIPGTKKTKPVNAKGKLIDKYRNLRRMCNLVTNEKSDAENESSASIDHDDLNESANWLKTYIEPWDLVIQNWKKTFPLRKVDNTIHTVEEYMEKWPILKHKDAYMLIQLDFQQLYENCSITLLLNDYQKWENFFMLIKNRSTLDKSTEEFLAPLLSDIRQDSKNAIQIAALPMLFPPKGRIRCKKVHWKPSIIESQESLITLVPTCANIEEKILQRRSKLCELNLTVQPYLIVVGASFATITDCYIIIDNNKYKVGSVLQGLDFAFKSFHVLNAQYPKESEHIWLLIEQALYKIESSTVTIPAVLTLLKEFENN